MCSFLITNRSVNDIDHVNYYLKYRGPDHTEIVKNKEWTFIHNLLSITGDFTKQPLEKDGVILLYNGEIYNFLENNKDYKSDGYFILDEYFSKEDNFFKDLDGEFAIVLLDFNKNLLYFGGDLFLTKPIFLGKENNEIAISSYASAINRLGFSKAWRLSPNTLYKLDLNSFKISTSSIYDWDLNQTVDSYEPWEIAFFESLNKRTMFTRNEFLVPMSSGYDSGSIVCGLKNSKNVKDFITYSFYGNEDLSIIEQRLQDHDNKILNSSISVEEQNYVLNKMQEIVEPFSYGPNPNELTHDGFSDIGAQGLFYLLNKVKNERGIKVQLSGQGGDEITGTLPSYGFGLYNPSFWPEDLESIFPWNNFYYGANWSYLNKEECIAGSLGIETRYPLLDKKVVQSFLNLTAEYKNRFYKAPLHYLLEKYNFPFKQEKLGFNLQIL